jgi:4-hydroxy-3-polyprenylbenzoate decarboxylase
MPYSGLKNFIRILEKEGELIRIKEFIDPILEITEITDRINKSTDSGKALLFENTRTAFPVLINAMGSEKRMALALSRGNLSEIETEIESLFRLISSPKENLWDKISMLPKLREVSSWMPKRVHKKGKCQEIIFKEPDLELFPILQCWPADGGRFITLPGVHTVDPETGTPNLGMYRMQVFGKDKTGMHWHKHKTGANHFEKYKKLGQRMPVSVSLGGDPVYIYAATAPMPENMDEYMLAGFLRKKHVRLVKCRTNDLWVPEDADVIIEGFIDPSEDLIWEGPFGDHTGFYSLADYYPVFHVTCITHRKDAVYPATIVGIPPMEDAWIGKATERIFLTPIRMSMIPELLDMDLPFAGVAHNLAVVKIEKTFAGQAVKVMNSLWGAGQMMFNKILVVAGKETDIHNYPGLLKQVINRFDPKNSLHFSKGPLDILDHSSSKFAFGSKLGIDATIPFEEEISQPEKKSQVHFVFSNTTIKNISGIEGFNNLYESLEIPVLICSVIKDEYFRKENLAKKLSEEKELSYFKVIVLVDSVVDVNDLFSVVWLVGGNLEPIRDISVIEFVNDSSCLLVDATIKTKTNDNLQRDWPNVVVSDEKTIKAINQKWESFGLGDFIPSPSLKYLPMVKNGGAIRKED